MKRRDFHRISLGASLGLIVPPYMAKLPAETELAGNSAKRMLKTDTHMHLFGLDNLKYSWLKNVPEINKTFLPEDFIQATRKAKVGKIVFMESGTDAGYSLREIDWVIEQAKKDKRIKGIVAKANIQEKGAFEPKLEKLLENGWVKGIRGGIHAEILASESFVRNMNLLAKNKLSFDLLTQPQALPDIAKAVQKTPDTTFILDHLGNPDIKGGEIEQWKKGIDALAEIPHVNCKISGIITRAGKAWTIDMLKPYVYHAIEKFGFDRLVYGGDWPVVLRAGSYISWAKAFEKLTAKFSKDELYKLYHVNADRIYQLDE